MQKIKYPKFHRQIVNDLLEGKFLLYTDYEKFQILKEENIFYIDFFKNTFDYDLNIRNEFAYLSSQNTDETFSRNFTIFLSVLCFEISQKGDFKTRLENDIFSYEEVENYLKSENFKEVTQEIGVNNLQTFLNNLGRRNIIQFTNTSSKDNFKFTKAINLFFEFAVQLSRQEKDEK